MNSKNLNKGATMIEYALIAGLIAIVAISSLRSVGLVLTAKMETISTTLGGGKTEDNDDQIDVPQDNTGTGDGPDTRSPEILE